MKTVELSYATPVETGAVAAIDLGMRSLSQRRYNEKLKRAADLLLLAVGLPVFLPVLVLACLALRLEGGSVFYRQARLGRDGRVFSIWKLRTMVTDAEAKLQQMIAQDATLRAEWETYQKLKRDPRVTWLGRWLRATSIDELPQLWNVLRGDMSLVGPRPMLPEQLPLYGRADAYFALRPGITGLWQVSDRNEAGFEQRARADHTYLRNLSLRQDIKILFATVAVVLGASGY